MKKNVMVLLFLIIMMSLQAKSLAAFKDFQNHIKNESKRVINPQMHAQIKAQRIQRDYGIGDTKNFWRWNFSNMPPAWEQAQATCRAVGEHCYLFVSDDQWNVNMNQDDVDSVMNYLENTTINGDNFGAIEMDIDLFGEIPDELDNDEKIIVYYSALGSFQGTSFDGYFSAYNEVTEAEAQTMNPPGHSNECEMIYMTCSPLDPTEPIRISVLSHELQHMIHWAGDINETTWVNEGMSELAMVHFGLPDPLTGFYQNANYSLNMWDQQWKDYIKVLLFFTYLDEHFNSDNLIADIVSEPLNGLAGISNQLTEHGFTIPIEEIFTNWTIANYLDEEGIYDDLYNYESLDLPQFNYHYLHNNFPVAQSGSIEPWATKYVKLFHQSELTVNLELDNNISVGVIKKGENISSEVEIVPINENGTITLEELEAPYTNHILVLANSNDEVLNFSYNIGEVGIEENNEILPDFKLNNYPNPFNPSTTISFTNKNNESFKLTIYNVRGQKIKEFHSIRNNSSNKNNPIQNIIWNGKNNKNEIVGSGIYFIRLNIGNNVETRKIMMIK